MAGELVVFAHVCVLYVFSTNTESLLGSVDTPETRQAWALSVERGSRQEGHSANKYSDNYFLYTWSKGNSRVL